MNALGRRPFVYKVVGFGLVALIALGVGWWGGRAVALNGGSDPEFIPHATACVNSFGWVRVIDPNAQPSDTNSLLKLLGFDPTQCKSGERQLLIASEEKVDGLRQEVVDGTIGGVPGFYRKYAKTDTTPATPKQVDVLCDEGDVATGGGGRVVAGDLMQSVPTEGGAVNANTTAADGWRVIGHGATTGGSFFVDVFVVCMDVSP